MTEKLNVLLLENKLGDAALIRELLATDGQSGFEIEAVLQLSVAIQRVRQGRFDILLLDLETPDSNGMEILRTIRKGAGPDIPIVVLTGNDDEMMGLAAIQEGAQDYIMKGQTSGLLLARVLCYSIGRHLAAQRVLKSEQFLRATLDALSSNIAIIDDSGIILEVNDAWRTFALCNGDSMAATCEDVNYLEACGNDGEGGVFAAGIRAVLSGDRESFEMEYPCNSPSEHFWFHGAVTRFLEQDLPRVVVVHENITGRKLADAEREKLESQLRQTQKMEAVGQLSGGIAHDFNNMLSVINGYSHMLLTSLSPSDPNYSRVQEISKAGQHSADLTKQLLSFARKQSITTKDLDIAGAIEGILKMLQRLLGENIELKLKPSAKIWFVKMDPSQLDQILTNLLVNARDAISGAGKVTIDIYSTELDAAYCNTRPGFVSGEYVVLAVGDSGSGMDKETLSHLFDPFFTTKEAGKGTGLGLATVFNIVKQNNGFINVYSEIGLGTTFKIYLPRHKSENMGRDETPETPEIFIGTETILLVEDEKSMLCLAKMQLESMGYTVLAADHPSQAINLAEEHNGEIHLLMTDVVLPDMNGQDLGKRISSIRPGIKYLFMSGYTADIVAANGIADKGIHFLEKPFSGRRLSAKLREVLCPIPKK
jgi:signal transduction histidine kinase/DNA-binding response OmpR family regulator